MAGELVLVTGASGYIAGHVIVMLLERGYRVRGTLRSLKRADEVRGWLANYMGRDPGDALEFVAADLSSDAGWSEAMQGVRYVQHIASPFPPALPTDPDELIVPAREGTLRVMRAAADAGVARVVQTSSMAAIAYDRTKPPGFIYSEADWTDGDDPKEAPYVRSKAVAERAAWDALPTLGKPPEWVAINPGLVVGPVMSKDASASIEVVSKLMNGDVPGLPRFGWTLVDVRDVADLHLRAMTDPKTAGERWAAGNRFMWMRDIAAVLKTRLGAKARRVPTRMLPDWVVRVVALFDRAVKAQLFELGRERRMTSAKAEAQLGWTQRDIEGSLVETAESLIAVGAIRP